VTAGAFVIESEPGPGPAAGELPYGSARRALISASFHRHSRRDKHSSDTTRVTIRKISFKPTSEDHPRLGRRGAEQPAVSGASSQVAQVFGTHRFRWARISRD
jgi:hypothetical protein